MPTPVRRLTAALLGVAAAATLAAAPAAASVADPSGAVGTEPRVGADQPAPYDDLAVPEPSGPAPVATTTLHLTDRSRQDPWVPSSGYRQLMVSMYYPSLLPIGRPSTYMTAAESEALLEFQAAQGFPLPDDMPRDALRDVATRALEDGVPRPAAARGRPLVVLSPGFSLSRSSLTALATDLASRGYVVAAVDHPYESAGIELPDGELTTCVACATAGPEQVPPVRAEDVSFVLDRLLGKRSAWRHSWLVDEDRIGMAGHSIGGNSAMTAMEADPRIDAGVNLDGTFFTPAPEHVDRPFLMLGTRRLHVPGGGVEEWDESWDKTWARLDGPRYWLSVEGSGHLSFTDFPPLVEQIGVEDPTTTLGGERSVEITRAYVGAFFDRHLRGRPAPLLDGPAPHFDEVAFHRP